MLEFLFVGNSYVFQNDLDIVTQVMFAQAGYTDAAATRLAEGGYTWPLHLEQTETSGTTWGAALVAPGNDWDWVILQEQSQIPGFPQDEAYWQESVAAGGALDDLAHALGSQTVLLLTWGRRLGDDTNPDLYPDFSTMQDHLSEGYLAYQTAFSTAERPVWVAPAGLAFARVYADVLETGATPEDDGTPFSTLYSADGSHPSPAGTYLVGAVLFETMTGESATGLPTPTNLTDEQAAYLQGVADRVVLDNPAGWTYPWQGDGAETDSGDTGADSGDAGGTGHPDANDGATPAGSDCTCNAGVPESAAGAVGMGMLAALRRKRANVHA